MSDVFMRALNAGDPVIVAWKAYSASTKYQNTFKWAAKEEHREGSLWAAFLEGWAAAQGIEAGTDETAEQAQPEGQEPGGEAMRPEDV